MRGMCFTVISAQLEGIVGQGVFSPMWGFFLIHNNEKFPDVICSGLQKHFEGHRQSHSLDIGFFGKDTLAM